MAETKQKKGFNAALYAVVAGIVVGVSVIVIRAFTGLCGYNRSNRRRIQRI